MSMSSTLKYLLWRNSSTFQAFLNATGHTQPINLGIGYVVGITGDCPTQILCKNWSASFQGVLQALHNLQKQSGMKTHIFPYQCFWVSLLLKVSGVNFGQITTG